MQELSNNNTFQHQTNVSSVKRERRSTDRRTLHERRCDRRVTSTPNQSLRTWFQKFINPRLGVDRRKGVDRRSTQIRVQPTAKSILTPEEIADLLR